MPQWQSLLRRGGRLPEKRGKLADCVRIDGRPDVINRRRRYRDWEGNTIVGKGRRSALVTLVERKSGYARIGRVDAMRSDLTLRAAKRRMKDLPQSRKRQSYSREFRQEAVQMVLDEHSVTSVADRLRLSSANLLYRWKKEVIGRAGPAARTLGDRVVQLEVELRRVERERDILKKALSILSRSG